MECFLPFVSRYSLNFNRVSFNSFSQSFPHVVSFSIESKNCVCLSVLPDAIIYAMNLGFYKKKNFRNLYFTYAPAEKLKAQKSIYQSDLSLFTTNFVFRNTKLNIFFNKSITMYISATVTTVSRPITSMDCI